MNTPSNVMSDLPMESRSAAPAGIPILRQLYCSVRRELWENRSIYIAPLAVAGLFLVGFTIGLLKLRSMANQSPDFHQKLQIEQQHGALQVAYGIAAAVIMGIAFLVAVFYCLDALYGERRDRSILFWKSLPVSDLTTVLSKLAIPMTVLPAVTFVVTLTTQLLMLLIQSVVLMGSGLTLAPAGQHALSFDSASGLLYHLITVHSLWYAPIYAWLLLVSSWARRAPLLWAIVPPVVIVVLEKIAFNSSHFADLLKNRLAGGAEQGTSPGLNMNLSALHHHAPLHVITSGGLWGGLVFAAICVAAAIQMRRTRGPL